MTYQGNLLLDKMLPLISMLHKEDSIESCDHIPRSKVLTPPGKESE